MVAQPLVAAGCVLTSVCTIAIFFWFLGSVLHWGAFSSSSSNSAVSDGSTKRRPEETSAHGTHHTSSHHHRDVGAEPDAETQSPLKVRPSKSQSQSRSGPKQRKRRQRGSGQKKAVEERLALFYVAVSAVTVSVDCLAWLIWISGHTGDRSFSWWLWDLFNGLLGVSVALLHGVMLARIHVAFGTSSLRVPPWTLCALLGFDLIFLALYLSYVALKNLRYKKSVDVLVAALVVNLALEAALVGAFVKRLLHVVRQQLASKASKPTTELKFTLKHSSCGNRHDRLLELAAKTCLLSAIACGSTQVAFLFVVLKITTEVRAIKLLSWFLSTFDLFVNALCMVLARKFATRAYARVCQVRGGCHGLCLWCLEASVQRAVSIGRQDEETAAAIASGTA